MGKLRMGSLKRASDKKDVELGGPGRAAKEPRVEAPAGRRPIIRETTSSEAASTMPPRSEGEGKAATGVPPEKVVAIHVVDVDTPEDVGTTESTPRAGAIVVAGRGQPVQPSYPEVVSDVEMHDLGKESAPPATSDLIPTFFAEFYGGDPSSYVTRAGINMPSSTSTADFCNVDFVNKLAELALLPFGPRDPSLQQARTIISDVYSSLFKAMHGATNAIDLIDNVSRENARLSDLEISARRAVGEEKEKRKLAESQAAVERARIALIEAELASEKDRLNKEISRMNSELARAAELMKEAEKRMEAGTKARRELEAARKTDQDAAASAEARCLAANERADKAVAVYKSSEAYLEELEESSSEAFVMGFEGCLFLIRNKFPQLDVSEIRRQDIPDDFTTDGGEAGPSAAAETDAGTDK